MLSEFCKNKTEELHKYQQYGAFEINFVNGILGDMLCWPKKILKLNKNLGDVLEFIEHTHKEVIILIVVGR